MGRLGRQSYRELIVWQKAFELARMIYSLSSSFPRHELYGLTAQLRRASVSVVSNIAEGAARGTTREFVRYLYISRGSLAETETQLLLANSIGYVRDLSANLKQIEEVGKLINSIIAGLRRRAPTPVRPSSLPPIP